MTKQTAVEWLMEQLSYDNGYGVKYPSHHDTADLTDFFKQAKAMEKEQMENAFEDGVYGERPFDQYYNEKFGGDK